MATSVIVNTGTGALFPTVTGSEFFVATIVNTISSDPGFGELEIVKVTARTSDTMTVIRGQEGTTAKSFPAGCLFELRPTAQAFDNIYTEVLELDGIVATKAPLASPVFTGNPTAPTPALNDNDTSIATTAYVVNQIHATPGRLSAIQVFSANGTYTPTVGTTFAIVEVLGAGGAGGGAVATAVGQFSTVICMPGRSLYALVAISVTTWLSS